MATSEVPGRASEPCLTTACHIVAASRQRSLHEYGIDPESREGPRILTAVELAEHRAQIKELLTVGREEMARLYEIVRRSGYVVMLASSTGVVVDYLAEPAQAEFLDSWGVCQGAVWSEAAEGTNGIGTAIVEQQPVTIHLRQHFRTRYADASCSAAPIFDPQANLLAILDVASIDPQLAEHAHVMALAVATYAARAIEERLFRHHFAGAWVIALLASDSPDAALLAVDRDHRIMGADRIARAALHLDEEGLDRGIDLWTVFRSNPRLLSRNVEGDFRADLVCATTGHAWHALVTPPLVASRSRSQRLLHGRPRIALLKAAPEAESAALRQGGLPAAVLRRVQAYIRSHLDEKLSLKTLAEVAGFSIFHFAREFRNSVGVSPHLYVLQTRIDLAKKALVETNEPIIQIAQRLGFSDQGRFATQFRRMVGMKPSAFRRRGQPAG